MKQQFITIRPEDLLERVARFKKEGCRLVQILCTRTTEGFELTYTFDKNYFLYHLRLTAALDGSVMSITSLYWYGFVLQFGQGGGSGSYSRGRHDFDAGGLQYRLYRNSECGE